MDPVEITDGKEPICRTILDALPQWFEIEEAKERFIRESAGLPMFACFVDETAVGFLTLEVHTKFAAGIHVIGVLPEWHRHGLGSRLVRHAERHVANQGLRFLTVKTLSPSNPDKNYEGTRRFYEAMGFVPLEEFPDLWDARNPCLMMIKCVGD